MFRLLITQGKKHSSLITLFCFIGLGATGAGLYLSRLAMFSLDVCFFTVNTDYKQLKKNRPDF